MSGWRGPEYPGEFPTLGHQVADLIEAKCAIPDGDRRGEPYILTDEQLRFVLWFYRLDPVTGRFVYSRGAQLVRPQKWGKGPFSAALICAEADPEGPVRFAGWDAYGEPVGKPWATPWVQVTAVSEDQTANVYRALVPMIELGSIAADIPDTGQTRINLPGGGRIEPVTASAISRLGARITFSVQDQAESWTKTNGGRALADAQRRNLGGMGGRFVETDNAWDPIEESVAQQTAEGQEPGVYFDDVDPGPGSVRNAQHRKRMLRKVYGDSAQGAGGWVDLERIDEEVVALLKRDAAQAERFYFNRKRAAEGAAFDPALIDSLALPKAVVEPGALVVAGVDGARFDDALAIVATDVVSGHQWPVDIIRRPADADEDYRHDFGRADAAMRDLFERYDVWRVYVDPQYIDELLDLWQGRWGDKRVLPWVTSRPRQICWAVRGYSTAMTLREMSHDGDAVFVEHLKNARRDPQRIYDDERQQLFTLTKDRRGSPHKIDAAMGGVLSWEARGDAIKSGATSRPPNVMTVYR